MAKYKKPKTPSYIYEDNTKMEEADRTYVYPKTAVSQIVLDNNIKAWATSSIYNIGDRCYYTDGNTYQCIQAHTSRETFENSYWEVVNLQTELDSLNKKFDFQVVSFPVNGWEGDAAPYTQTISATGFTGSDTEHPIISLNYPDVITTETSEDYEEAFSFISLIETVSGGLKATCMHDKPMYDIYVNVMG